MAELLSPDLGASEPAVFPGSTLLPVVVSAPLSVAFLPPEVSLESGLGVESFVALLDSVSSVEDAGALADASDEFFVVSPAGAAAVSSGFCADVSVALPSAAESAEVAVSAGVLAATYIRELVDRKEHDPGDDLISRLATDYVATGQLNRETAAITDAVMMQAGHETTANMIALGTVALLQHRDVFERLGQTDDQSVIANMVEELMRYLTIVHSQVDRVAIEDLTIGGQPIHAGDFLVMNLPAGNWDPDFVDNPEEFDVDRNTRGHLGFGYGVHQCIWQNLAQVEMQIAFATLARRLPEPRLAIAGCTEVQRRIRHLRHEEASRYVVTTSDLRFDEQVP